MISVTARSDTDGARVVLPAPDGERLAWSGSTPRSHRVAKLPRAGEYVIGVADLDAEPVQYELEVRTLEPGELALGTPVASRLNDGPRSEVWSFAGAVARTVEVEELGPDLSGTGVLEPTAQADVWRFSGVEGQVVSVVAHSDAFNPQVALLSPDGEELAWDISSGSGTDSLLVATLPHTGEYLVVVSLFEGDAGPYEVAVREAEVERLVPGRTAAGRLEEGEESVLWGFARVAGQVLRVTASSDAFDPRFVLVSPDGERVEWYHHFEWPLLATLSRSGLHVISVTAVDDKPGPLSAAAMEQETVFGVVQKPLCASTRTRASKWATASAVASWRLCSTAMPPDAPPCIWQQAGMTPVSSWSSCGVGRT